MLNIALIVAGGSGTRTGNVVPKQFITVNEIPIIIYTLLNIQKISVIDKIVVSVSKEWTAFVKSYAKQYNIDKLSDIIEAGDTRHQTISQAIHYLTCEYSADSKIVIIDSNRPLIPSKVVEQSIDISRSGECTVALSQCFDTMYTSSNGITVDGQINRNILYGGQSPECAILGDLKKVYEFANTNSLEDVTAALFMACFKTVRVVEGSSKSFKITTKDDLDLFKALITVKENKYLE